MHIQQVLPVAALILCGATPCTLSASTINSSAFVRTDDGPQSCDATSDGNPINCLSQGPNGSAHIASANSLATLGSAFATGSVCCGDNATGTARAGGLALFDETLLATGGTGSVTLTGHYQVSFFGGGDGTCPCGSLYFSQASTSYTVPQIFSGEIELVSQFTFGVPFDVQGIAIVGVSSEEQYTSSVKLLGFTDANGNPVSVAPLLEPQMFWCVPAGLLMLVILRKQGRADSPYKASHRARTRWSRRSLPYYQPSAPSRLSYRSYRDCLGPAIHR